MGSDDRKTAGQRIRALEKGFKIIEILRDIDEGTASEVASRAEMPLSSTYVYLQTLQDIGFIVQTDDTYRLSFRFLDYGGKMRQQMAFFQHGRQEIDKLAQETKEVAAMGIEEAGLRVLLYVAHGDNGMYDNAPTGEYTNMHWSSLGKVILANLPQRRIMDIVETHGLPSATDDTITSRDHLFNELETVREQGFAIEDEEHRTGLRAVAVPVVVEDTVLGSISISGPKSRLGIDSVMNEYLDSIESAANLIEIQFAHN